MATRRQDRRHRARRRRPPAFQHHGAGHPRRSDRVVGSGVDRRAHLRAPREPSAAGTAGTSDLGADVVTARRDGALATLRRLGVDDAALDAGSIDDATVERLLDGADAAAAAEALGEVAGAPTAALLAHRAQVASDRTVAKALRRALFRFEQRGVPVPRIRETAEHRPAAGGPSSKGSSRPTTAAATACSGCCGRRAAAARCSLRRRRTSRTACATSASRR